MREIKFRSWDRHTKTMDIPDNIANDIDGNKYQIMQYTGLKDKNGKEIYEGDIVELRDNGMGTGYEYEVYWDEEWLAFRMGHAMLSGLDVEIIGNIYENPELLKTTKLP